MEHKSDGDTFFVVVALGTVPQKLKDARGNGRIETIQTTEQDQLGYLEES